MHGPFRGLEMVKQRLVEIRKLVEIDEGQRNYSISGGVSQVTHGRLIMRILTMRG